VFPGRGNKWKYSNVNREIDDSFLHILSQCSAAKAKLGLITGKQNIIVVKRVGFSVVICGMLCNHFQSFSVIICKIEK
jgi:hypothetical protein